jgi:4-amino-4-deoxy-L-arabinose transferase-like glycosyltransferase
VGTTVCSLYARRRSASLPLASLLKTISLNARLSHLDSPGPIRTYAVEEANIEIPLWSVPLVLGVLYVCLFSGLGALGFIGPDEPRYAAIARAMAETQDWVTPRLWGTPWFEKPVLYYWVAGIAMRIFGVSEFAARLPSALGALLAVLAVAWTALRSCGIGAAWYSLLMLPTSVAMIGFARAATPDMLFAGLLTAAMAVAVEMLQKPRPGAVLRIAFGFFLGAAVLAKGPAAVILAGGSTLLWAALSRQWSAPFRFLHPLVVAAFCATALPWYALCAVRNPGFLRDFFWHHNFERYLTPVFQHPQPFWFFGPILLLAILPWILFSVITISDAVCSVRNRAYIQSPGMFFACWTAFPVIFFSFSQSKLPGYALPAVPPLFILLGCGVSRSIQGNAKTALRVLGWTGVLFFPLAIPLSVEMTGGTLDIFRPEYVLAGLVAFGCGVVIVIFAMTKRPRAAFMLVVLLITSLVEIANLKILPRLDRQLSSRSLALELLNTSPSEGDVATYDIPRAWHYGLNFYLHRDLPEWTPGSSEPRWVAGSIATDPGFQLHYDIHLDEIAEANGFQVCLYHRK